MVLEATDTKIDLSPSTHSRTCIHNCSLVKSKRQKFAIFTNRTIDFYLILSFVYEKSISRKNILAALIKNQQLINYEDVCILSQNYIHFLKTDVSDFSRMPQSGFSVKILVFQKVHNWNIHVVGNLRK